MNIEPINNKDAFKAAINRVEALWNASPGTVEGDELDILTTLIEAYEKSNFPIPDPHPIEAIRFRIEQLALED